MKTLRNLVFVAVAMSASTPAVASPSLLVAIPSLSALTIEASGWIGDELRALHRVITRIPTFVRAQPTVSVAAANHIIVAASRLPRDGKYSQATSGARRGN